MFAMIGVFWLAIFIPVLAVQMRRLHDINRSGWWLGAYWGLFVIYFVVSNAPSDDLSFSIGSAASVGITGFIFFIYWMVLLIFFCLRGTRGANRYGEDPYGPDVQEVFACRSTWPKGLH